jgi:hypothetical protein
VSASTFVCELFNNGIKKEGEEKERNPKFSKRTVELTKPVEAWLKKEVSQSENSNSMHVGGHYS